MLLCVVATRQSRACRTESGGDDDDGDGHGDGDDDGDDNDDDDDVRRG